MDVLLMFRRYRCKQLLFGSAAVCGSAAVFGSGTVFDAATKATTPGALRR